MINLIGWGTVVWAAFHFGIAQLAAAYMGVAMLTLASI
jgi:hypothetical protein